MGFAFVVAATAGSSGGGNVTTSAINTGGCDFFVAIHGSYRLGTAPTIVSEGGASANTWADLTLRDSGVFSACRISYTTNYPANTNGSHTFTAGGGGGSFPAVTILGFSGVKATAPFDQESGSNTLTPGSLTPSEDNCLVIAALGWTTSSTPTTGGSFVNPTNYFTDYLSGNHFGVAAGYWIQTTASAANPTWTASGATDYATALAVFKSAAGGGGTNWGPWVLSNQWNRLVRDF